MKKKVIYVWCWTTNETNGGKVWVKLMSFNLAFTCSIARVDQQSATTPVLCPNYKSKMYHSSLNNSRVVYFE